MDNFTRANFFLHYLLVTNVMSAYATNRVIVSMHALMSKFSTGFTVKLSHPAADRLFIKFVTHLRFNS